MNFAQLARQRGTRIVGRLQLKQPDGVGVDESAVGVDIGWLNGCHTLSSVSDTRKRFRAWFNNVLEPAMNRTADRDGLESGGCVQCADVGVLRKQASPLKFYPAFPQPLFAYSIYLVL
jgi:hypothetical protein